MLSLNYKKYKKNDNLLKNKNVNYEIIDTFYIKIL